MGFKTDYTTHAVGKVFKGTIGKFLGFGRRRRSRRCRQSMYGAGGKRGMRWGFKSCSKCHTRHRCTGHHRKGCRKGERKSKYKAFKAIRSLQQLARLKKLARG